MREARAAAALEHDHIVPIYHVGEDRGVPYIVMPFLKGNRSTNASSADEQLPLAEMLRIGREIAEGLGAAHATGRSIATSSRPISGWRTAPSPSGRGAGGEGRVKILDFGLARAATQDAGLTQQGAIIGTPAYMAPEQGRGEDVDARCDLFSLGVVLYRMCTGQQPFHGKDTVSTLMAVAMHEPPLPDTLNTELPPELSDLVMKLLEKDVDKRVSSAAEVIQTLQGMEKKLAMQKLAEEKTEAMHVGDPNQGITTKPSRQAARNVAAHSENASTIAVALHKRRRRPLVLAALFLALLFVGGVGTFGIIRFATPEGDFVVNTDDPDFKFSVSKGTVILEDAKTKRTYKLKAERKGNGEYELDVTDLGADLSFKVKQFTIKRGQEFALKATFEPRQVVAGAVAAARSRMAQDGRGAAGRQAGRSGQGRADETQSGLRRQGGAQIDKDGVVTELQFLTDKVTDISPVRALIQLKSLYCPGVEGKERAVRDLSSLAGMRLENLNIDITSVSDLSPLKDMKLKALSMVAAPVADLTPLRGMADDLRVLNIGVTNVSDLSPLKDMKNLEMLVFYKTAVTDVSALKGMKLTNLQCVGSKVSDLTPLLGMPLNQLDCGWTKVTDLSPLRGMPLKNLTCDFKKERDTAFLRSIKSLETINGKPAAQFWQEVDGTAPPREPLTWSMVRKFDEHTGAVRGLAMSRDGRYVVIGSMRRHGHPVGHVQRQETPVFRAIQGRQ